MIIPKVDHHKYLEALGQLVTAYSDMEAWMKHIAVKLANPNNLKVGRTLIWDLPFQPLRIKLMSLYRLREKDRSRVKEFESLLNGIKNYEKRRNDMIHGDWRLLWLLEHDFAIRIKPKLNFEKGYVNIPQKIKFSDINDLINQIDLSSKALIRIYSEWNWKYKRKPKE